VASKQQQDFIWDKIVYANPIKPKETLQALDQYKPLVTYDNLSELRKIKQYAPHAGLTLRLRVPNTGSMVEISSKFGCAPGEAVDLLAEAFRIGLVVEALSFRVGSQCTNFNNFVQALNISAAVIAEAQARGHRRHLGGPHHRQGHPRRHGHHLAIRRTAGPGDRRAGLRGEHRRVLERLGDVVQRLPAGQSGARERVVVMFGHCPCHLKAFQFPARRADSTSTSNPAPAASRRRRAQFRISRGTHAST
jgi:hypothetical protein